MVLSLGVNVVDFRLFIISCDFFSCLVFLLCFSWQGRDPKKPDNGEWRHKAFVIFIFFKFSYPLLSCWKGNCLVGVRWRQCGGSQSLWPASLPRSKSRDWLVPVLVRLWEMWGPADTIKNIIRSKYSKYKDCITVGTWIMLVEWCMCSVTRWLRSRHQTGMKAVERDGRSGNWTSHQSDPSYCTTTYLPLRESFI